LRCGLFGTLIICTFIKYHHWVENLHENVWFWISAPWTVLFETTTQTCKL